MARVTTSDVENIADFSELSASDIQPFVDDANTFVDDRLKGEGLSDALLTMIEKWVAAHLASMREQRVSRQEAGSTRFYYEGDDEGMGLQYTRYGQTALVLDPTGNLASGVGDLKNIVETVNKDDD